MKAISVMQPYADLIADREKPIENRTHDSFRHRGEIAIHASKTSRYLTAEALREHVTGAIVAVGNLVAVLDKEEIESRGEETPNEYPEGCTENTWGKLAASLHCEGPYCLIIENVRRVVPYEINGQLGVWDAGPLKYVDGEGCGTLVLDESLRPPKPSGAE